MPDTISELVALPNGGTIDRARLLCSTVADGEPVSKARPRFGANGQVYTPRTTTLAERDLGWRTREQNEGFDPASAAVVLDVVFYVKRPANYAVKAGSDRSDLDNLIKLVKDALNNIAYTDDHLVEKIVARIVRGDPNPRTEFAVYLLEE